MYAIHTYIHTHTVLEQNRISVEAQRCEPIPPCLKVRELRLLKGVNKYGYTPDLGCSCLPFGTRRWPIVVGPFCPNQKSENSSILLLLLLK